jgi:hypothetical protein
LVRLPFLCFELKGKTNFTDEVSPLKLSTGKAQIIPGAGCVCINMNSFSLKPREVELDIQGVIS